MRVIVALLSGLLVAAGCAGSEDEPSGAGASGDLVTISNVQQIASAFNDDTGRPRLVLLLSPT
jgi:hypothetical protein